MSNISRPASIFSSPAAAPEMDSRWVEILDVTPSGFVEFSYHVGFKEISMHLMMPMEVFTAFCAENCVKLIADLS